MIDYVKLGGEEYPVKFGFNAVRLYCDDTGIKLGAITDVFGPDGTLTNLIKLAWYGLRDGSRSGKKPFELTIDDVSDLMDEQGKLQAINLIFLNQFTANFQSPAEVDGT